MTFFFKFRFQHHARYQKQTFKSVGFSRTNKSWEEQGSRR